MTRKKLTVYDYLKCKGQRQLSVLFVHNAEEARAAEEAGIDMICTSHDAPQFGIFNSFDEKLLETLWEMYRKRPTNEKN